MLHPAIFDTSQICRSYGINHMVISPGSRNAPLTLSFARNESIKKWIIPDERSAGFVALGVAQFLKTPVALCCTSGTALLNYGPAVAEAYYRKIPLVVLSADRPPELIDQRDGQTIRQFNVLNNHVAHSEQLPVVEDDQTADEYIRKLKKSLEKSLINSEPVHINVPFREPFYPSENQDLAFNEYPSWKPEKKAKNSKIPVSSTFDGKKVLILCGQKGKEPQLDHELTAIQDIVPVIQSPLNNLNIEGIEHVDLFISDQGELKPDVLITYGLSVLSKKLKGYLRKFKPDVHYHLDPLGIEVDTYQSNPILLRTDLTSFLSRTSLRGVNPEYHRYWKSLSTKAKDGIRAFSQTDTFSEASCFQEILAALPKDSHLHLSNSMPVRFADLLGIKPSIECWGNRGTSGIDGCTSTVVGMSLVTDKPNILITGDLAFLYDRNAFFNNYITKNLRIIVSNNSGGGIFRLIQGPSSQPELEEYFETRHNFNAKHICDENGIGYQTAQNFTELAECLSAFFDDADHPKLLEVFTDPITNEKEFKRLKNSV